MRSTIYTTLFIGYMIINGCASSIDFKDTISVSSGIKSEYDSLGKVTKHTGPEYRKDYYKLFLSAWKNDRIGITHYRITVKVYYHGVSRSYDSADDLNGNKLDFIPTSNKPDYCDNSGCWYEDIFDLNVSREYLQKYQEKGITIKVSGKSEHYQIFSIPPAYLKAFLSVVK
jgi:hypothetical protein